MVAVAPRLRLDYITENARKTFVKRTLEGTSRKRRRVSGFRARMATPGGRRVISARRSKGRHQLAI